MSIATLARKSRAQRGASTRTGWTLATTKSGNCPGPCGGGAPAKQHSFRRLMKNKARPGVEQETTAPCCTRTQTVTVTDISGNPSNYIGETWVQVTHWANPGQPPTGGSINGSSGTLIEFTGDVNGPWTAVFRMNCEPDTQFTNGDGGKTHSIIPASDWPATGGAGGQGPSAALSSGGTAHPPVDTYAPCDCCPPVATWKKTNDPKGEQSIGYYLWRKKQLTHNCIKHCIPHREHYNATCTRTQTVTGVGTSSNSPGNHIGETWYQVDGNGNPTSAQGTLIEFTENPAGGAWVAVFRMNCEPDTQFKNNWPHHGTHSIKLVSNHSVVLDDGGNAQTPVNTIVPGAPFETSCHGPCDNVGCKCNCNKSMGGTACCVVHKTMLPLSNSENIAWVVEDRTCLQTSKPDPRNPNIC